MKQLSIRLIDNQTEIGEMKLQMRSFILMGTKLQQLKDGESLLDGLTLEKDNWFPIFKNKECSGHL